MDVDSGEITQLLRRVRQGDNQAAEQLIPIVYKQLRELASHLLRAERTGHSLQTTALVHEAFIRLLGSSQQVDWQNRNHFFAVSAKLMRRILIDHARTVNAQKRGGGIRRVSLESALVFTEEDSAELLALDEALQRLEQWDPRQAQIIEMHFFAGLSFPEIAEVLAVSSRTIRRDWNMARAWLYDELTKRIER